MADQPALPTFTDDDGYTPPYAAPTSDPGRVIRSAAGRITARPAALAADEKTGPKTWLATLDLPIIIVVLLLLSIGGMMVYSTTFDWAYQEFGSESYIFMQHIRNMVIGAVVFVVMTLIDYRVWKRFAPVLLLGTIGALIAVLVFSDQVFGARRAFLNGSYQPGELAELIVVVYLAAWLSSKNTRVATVFNGLLPFGILLAIIGGLVMLQPDLSTAATIFAVAAIMYFLAGANLYHLVGIGALLGVGGFVLSQQLFDYAEDRVSSFAAGLTDLPQSSWHVQQAILAFVNGGWTGVGLGQGRQKFGFLPAPHTDSIFAVIGEELGVIGAMFVVLLFVTFVFRGLMIARRARDPFGALLAAGITLWIIVKALLNIAVMLSLVPPTGVALPFISFGGSSLVVVLAGAGLLLSVARVTALNAIPEGRTARADHDRGWGNRWSRLSSPRSR